MMPRRLRVAWFSRLLRHPETEWVYFKPRNPRGDLQNIEITFEFQGHGSKVKVTEAENVSRQLKNCLWEIAKT